MRRAFAEHGLGRVLPERAGAAIGGRFPEGLDIADGCHMFVFHGRLRSLLRFVRIGGGILRAHDDGDGRRSSRQQQVLLALREQAISFDLLPKAAELLEEFGNTVRNML